MQSYRRPADHGRAKEGSAHSWNNVEAAMADSNSRGHNLSQIGSTRASQDNDYRTLTQEWQARLKQLELVRRGRHAHSRKPRCSRICSC
jgi:hypothetical protein